MDLVPIWIFAIVWIGLLLLAAEVGYRLGLVALKRPKHENDAPVGAIVGALLALAAFILAFTFGVASNHFDARTALVMEHANAIGTVYQRADFLDEAERSEARSLLAMYTDDVLTVATTQDPALAKTALAEVIKIESRLWQTATRAAMHTEGSNTHALYVESLNQMFEVRFARLLMGLETRIPQAIWGFLALLLALSLFGVGYQTALQHSRRSWSTVFLAMALTVLIILILLLDRPDIPMLSVSEAPIISIRATMDATPMAP